MNGNQKNKGFQQLRELALQDSRRRLPNYPEAARYVKPYTDKTANGLTRAIIDFLRFNGWQAERINCTGRMIDNTKVVRDVCGFSRTIGSVKWMPTSGQKGTADISATIKGRSVKIEVKMKDRQSSDQKAYQEAIEKAGGVYWIVRSFEEFIKLYEGLR
jgi:Holliday junction resolvase